MDGEIKANETIFLSPNHRYKIELNNILLDQIISSKYFRFIKTRKVLADLSLI